MAAAGCEDAFDNSDNGAWEAETDALINPAVFSIPPRTSKKAKAYEVCQLLMFLFQYGAG